MSELPKINMSKEDFEIPAEVTEELVAQGDAESQAAGELENAMGPIEAMMGEAVLRALNEETERLNALNRGGSVAGDEGVASETGNSILSALDEGEPVAERREIFTSEAKGRKRRGAGVGNSGVGNSGGKHTEARAGKRLAAPEKKGVIDRLKQAREEAGYVGKRVLKATDLPGNTGRVKNAGFGETPRGFIETDDEDEAALEAAFREVTLDEILAEEGPERKTPVEQVAEKLGRAKVAEIIIGAIGTAREQEGNYYDYLQGQADDNEVPYEDLLQLVREQVKSGYDERKAKIKFYYSLSQKDFAAAAEVGKLQRRDARKKGADHRASDLKFSQDFMEDGEVTWTGFDGERDAQSDEVTLVFGGDLIDEPSFDALMLSAVGVDEVDLQKKCLAVVSDKPGLKGLLARNGLAIPVERVGKGAESWQRQARDADELRAKKAELVEKHEHNAELRREVLTNVDTAKARERMQKLAEKIRPEDWDEIFEQFQGSETDLEYEAAERQAFATMLDRLGVKGASEVRYIDDEQDKRAGYLTTMKDKEGYYMYIATLNRQHVPLGSITKSVGVLSHEAGHAWQDSLVRRRKAGEEMSDEERRLAEQFGYNNDVYIPPEVDRVGYQGQMMEVYSGELQNSCVEALYDRYEANHKTPLQKVAEALQEVLKRPEAHVEKE